MTKLFINSTDPDLASRMKPEVYAKIVERRKELGKAFERILDHKSEITLEIGCGHGHFLTAYAKNNPEELCIGIDVNRGRIFKARKKVDRMNLTNVHFLETESMEFLSMLPEGIHLANTWILYPDPWPKKRHFKNRIVQAEFLTDLAKATIPGGKIFLRSDYEPYLEWSAELIDNSRDWKQVDSFDWPELAVTVFQELTNNQHFSLVAELNPTEQ